MNASTQEVTTFEGEVIERLTTVEDIGRRPAVTWANYHGDVSNGVAALIEHDVPLGPNTLTEWLWPVSASYDPNLKRTRVGFSYLPPATHRSAA